MADTERLLDAFAHARSNASPSRDTDSGVKPATPVP